MKDLIERQAAIEALKYNQDVYSHNFHDDPIDKYTTAIIAADIDTLVKLPSAQPDLDEWCTDCKEYDKEKHCCPRFNRVIWEALRDAERLEK